MRKEYRYMFKDSQWADLSPLRNNGWGFDIHNHLWKCPQTGWHYPTMKALGIQAQRGRKGAKQ